LEGVSWNPEAISTDWVVPHGEADSTFEGRITGLTGDAFTTGPTVGTWFELSTIRTWELVQDETGELSNSFTLEVRKDGGAVLDSAVYNLTATRANTLLDDLVSWWSMDETSGTRADAHGSNDLTETNTVGYVTGKVSNAAQTIAANDEELTKTSASGLNGGDRDFTVAMWLRLDDDPNSSFIKMGQVHDSNFGDTDWRLHISFTDIATFGVVATSTEQTIGATSFGTLSEDVWYFIVMWHDAGANTLNIQINDGTVDTNSSFTTPTHQTLATSLVMGQAWGVIATSASYDELGFWSRVLTTQERTDLYNSGNGIGYPT